MAFLIRRASSLSAASNKSVLATGSGIIVHPRGFILTSVHLLGQGEGILCARIPKIEEPFAPPGTNLYRLRVVKKSERYDLALLKIDAYQSGGCFIPLPPSRRFPFLTFGFSRELEPLDPLYGFGFPLLHRMGDSCCCGISGVAGRVAGLDFKRGWIKAVLPVSPGFSGGPACTRRGELVGIISAIKLDRESQAQVALLRPVHLLSSFLQGTPPGFLLRRAREDE